MRFIVEGTDRAGKSTIVTALKREMTAMLGREVRVVHCNKDSCNWQDPDQVLSVIEGADIVDRLYDSEYVYSKVVRGGASLADDLFLKLRCEQEKLGATTIFVHSGEATIRQRFEWSEGEYVDVEQALRIQREYTELYMRARPFSFAFLSGEMSAVETRTALINLCNSKWEPFSESPRSKPGGAEHAVDD